MLVSGAVPESPSPCGTNCTYNITFDGPTFKCNTTFRNETSKLDYTNLSGDSLFYKPYYAGACESYDRRRFMFSSFDMTLERLLGYSNVTGLLHEKQTLRCQPAWAVYDVSFGYANGVRSLAHNKSRVMSLEDTFVAGAWPNTTLGDDSGWDKTTVQNLKNFNHYAVLDTIVSSLAGSYTQIEEAVDGPNFTFTTENGTKTVYSPVRAAFSYLDTKSGDIMNTMPYFALGNPDWQIGE